MSKPGVKPDLEELGRALVEKGPVKTLRTPKRVRILFGGTWVVDTTSALYVWEHPFYPYYYVPRAAFPEGSLAEQVSGLPPPSVPARATTGTGYRYDILRLAAGGRSTDRVLGISYLGGGRVEGEEGEEEGEDGRRELRDMVRVEFDAADAWFEEDTPIAVHPKDPFRRVDVLHSARPLRVVVGGAEVARAASSYHLYETGLPRRFYLPPTSIADWGALRASGTRTQCPYKGEAEYYDVVLGDGETYKDLVWYYRTPAAECALIAGCLCFYNEKVDVELGGEWLERPKTHFS